jgi:hypothetical protein
MNNMKTKDGNNIKKKILVGVIGIGVVLVCGISMRSEVVTIKTEQLSLVSVDDVVRYPEHFTDITAVMGRVIAIDESRTFFVLGCEDVCVMMPVAYTGHMPDVGSDVIVYGTVTLQDGKYIFEAQEVKM